MGNRYVIFLCFIIGIVRIQAQALFDFSGIKEINVNNIGAITENNQVKGYYLFYLLDKIDERNNLYALDILDVNLKRTHSIEMKKPIGARLMSSAYNSESFYFSFFSKQEKIMEYVTYNKNGTYIASYKRDLGKWETHVLSFSANNKGEFAAIPNGGFIALGFRKDKKFQRKVEMIDNNGAIKWAVTSGNVLKKAIESSTLLYADERVTVVEMLTRKKLLSSKIVKDEIIFYKTSDGSEQVKIDVNEAKHILDIDGVTYDDATGSYYLYGQYDYLKGVFILELDVMGKIKQEKYYSWTDKVFKSVIREDYITQFTQRREVIHSLIKTSECFFLITEQVIPYSNVTTVYNPRPEKGEIYTGLSLYDMMAFELDTHLNLKKSFVFYKEKTDAFISFTAHLDRLVEMAKNAKAFDCVFIAVSADKKIFNIAYVNFDKQKKQTNFNVGNISYTREGELKCDKITIKTKPNVFFVLPSKPGYIAIFEYFESTKKASIRLEKLNI